MAERDITITELHAAFALAEAAIECTNLHNMSFGPGRSITRDEHEKRMVVYLDRLDAFIRTLPDAVATFEIPLTDAQPHDWQPLDETTA
jgi:hypothetical protein